MCECRQLQDEIDCADPKMPQWWLEMQAHVHHHGSGQKIEAAGSIGAGIKVGSDRRTTQHAGVSHGGSLATPSSGSRGEVSEYNNCSNSMNSTDVGMSLSASEAPSSDPVMPGDVTTMEGACTHTELGTEEWRAEAEVSARNLNDQCVVTHAVDISSLYKPPPPMQTLSACTG